MQSGEMKLEDAKELQNIFKSNLNETLKAGNTSKNLLNKIKEIIYSLYRIKILLKKYTAIKRIFNKAIKQNRIYIFEF